MDTSKLTPHERATLTLRWDLVRGSASGVLDPFWQTFALLIAIRVFEASDTYKALIPAAHGLGLLLTPLTISLAAVLPWRLGKIGAAFMVVAGTTLILGTLALSLNTYVTTVFVYQIIIAQLSPLAVAIYARNYSSKDRGSRVSTAFLLTSVFSPIIAAGFGFLLDTDLNYFRIVLLLTAIACLVAAYAFLRMPSDPLPKEKAGNPWSNFSLIWKDKLFGAMITGWMFMGIGNLMTIPLRVDYLAAEKWGINASASTIAIVLIGIPLVTQLLMTRLMGSIFDKANFIFLRITLNVCFIGGIALTFLTQELWIIGIGMFLNGIALAGARVVWSLWVTKVADADRAGAYMSIHTSLTGVRALISPFIGFYLISFLAPMTVATIACSLIVISSLIFAPLNRAVQERSRVAGQD